jgi:hypothetical protein
MLVITGIIYCSFSSAFAYSGGSGISEDPYQIAVVQDWNDLMNTPYDWNDCFILTADLDLQDIELKPVGISQSIYFSGVFDGNGHIIHNANITYTQLSYFDYYVGLFGVSSGQIRNLGVEDVNVNGGSRVGGLVGMNWGTVTNCYSTGLVAGADDHGTYIGGLVGRNFDPITNCYSSATVNGHENAGGLVGWNIGTIADCCAAGVVSGNPCAGGLVGTNAGGTITNCYASGAVSGVYVGGLVGANYDTDYAEQGWRFCNITKCYATGNVTGGSYVGGLVGINSYYYFVGSSGGGHITDCYATGEVNGVQYIGGLAGRNGYLYDGTITNCYSIGAVSGDANVGGLVGANNNSSGSVINGGFWDIETSGQTISTGGTGKTTSEMKVLSTFLSAGWDFVDVWGIGENQTYPFLKKYPAGDLNYDGQVNFADFVLFSNHWLQGT